MKVHLICGEANKKSNNRLLIVLVAIMMHKTTYDFNLWHHN